MLARKSQDMFWFSPPRVFFKHETGFSLGFRNTRILTPVSQKSEQQFFSRQSHRFSGDVNSIENHLWVDFQSGLLMEFGSSARTQSWNGGSGASGRGVMGLEVGPEVWSYNGKCIMGQKKKPGS